MSDLFLMLFCRRLQEKNPSFSTCLLHVEHRSPTKTMLSVIKQAILCESNQIIHDLNKAAQK